MKRNRRKLAVPVRIHRWGCGHVRQLKALYLPKTVDHDGPCGRCRRRMVTGQLMSFIGYDNLMASINQSIEDMGKVARLANR